jgi:hypothetical protein
MITKAEIRIVSDGVEVTIPKAMLDRLHVAAGFTLYVMEHDSGLLLTPFDPTSADDVLRTRRMAPR